jgi:hypothetical protein
MAKEFDLFDRRDILISATREVLGLAESCGDDIAKRRDYVLEASRIAVRLVEVQKEIEAIYGDE